MSNELLDITGAQIRAARAMVKMTGEELAAKARVSISTIRRAEAASSVPTITAANQAAIRRTLENAGVEFINQNGVQRRIENFD